MYRNIIQLKQIVAGATNKEVTALFQEPPLKLQLYDACALVGVVLPSKGKHLSSSFFFLTFCLAFLSIFHRPAAARSGNFPYHYLSHPHTFHFSPREHLYGGEKEEVISVTMSLVSTLALTLSQFAAGRDTARYKSARTIVYWTQWKRGTTKHNNSFLTSQIDGWRTTLQVAGSANLDNSLPRINYDS
jgi:hypothetical protein